MCVHVYICNLYIYVYITFISYIYLVIFSKIYLTDIIKYSNEKNMTYNCYLYIYHLYIYIIYYKYFKHTHLQTAIFRIVHRFVILCFFVRSREEEERGRGLRKSAKIISEKCTLYTFLKINAIYISIYITYSNV